MHQGNFKTLAARFITDGAGVRTMSHKSITHQRNPLATILMAMRLQPLHLARPVGGQGGIIIYREHDAVAWG